MCNSRRVFSLTACLAFFCLAGFGQAPPPVILEVQLENAVIYVTDVSDVSRFATDPNVTTVSPPTMRSFGTSLVIADIVAVNGRPAKGTATINQRRTSFSASPTPGQAISDTGRASLNGYALELLQTDGTAIGSIFASGFGGGGTPPGAPLTVTTSNNAVVGGTGAFLGARGQLGAKPVTLPVRIASVTEDPINRRTYGGGSFTIVVHLLPTSRPEILATTHASDFTLVTAANPARAGEVLTLWATGLGPTRPGVDPGQPFTASPLRVVSSPVEVSVNGAPAEILYAGGVPGTVDGYQVNLRLPAGITPGSASLQMRVAWIAGPEVKIVIQ